uniref:Putative oxidoreductase n=1 Tax=termite gut metagenome TaxID=433724 RepID=S0DG04_9ZZZZ
MDTKPVKTAVVGCGAISSTYIPNLMHLFSIIELAALCDVRPEAARGQAEAFGVGRVMTPEEVESAGDIELVVNLTGPGAHYDVTKRMLLAGKHVFSEKTIAATVEQGRELAQLAQERNLTLGVAPDTVLGAGLQTARKVLDAGLIGTPTSCVACANRNQMLNSELFPFIRQSAAGAFPYDVGVYYVAALLSLLGPVSSVTGLAAKAPRRPRQVLHNGGDADGWEMPGVDLLAGSLQFESGVLGSVHFDGTSINTEQPLLVIYGTQGILRLGDPNRFDGAVTLVRPEAEPGEIPFTHGFGGRPVEGGVAGAQGHRGVGAAEMAWAIRERRAARCGAAFGLHTLEVLQGLERSAGSHQPWAPASTFTFEPLAAGFYDTTFGGLLRADAESSLRMR